MSNFVHWLYPGQILSDDPASPATDPVRTENAIHMLTAVLGFSNRKMFKISTINPQTPVARKIVDEVVFRRFQGEGVEFFKSGLTDPPLRFLMRIFWKLPI